MNDTSAERNLLAAVIAHGTDAYIDAEPFITDSAITDPGSRAVWRCLRRVLSDSPPVKGVDVALLMAAAHSEGLAAMMAEPSETAHLRAILNASRMVELSSARPLAAKLARLDVARRLDAALDRGKDSLSRVTGDEPISEVLSMAEAPLYELGASLGGGEDESGPIGDGALEYVRSLMDTPRETAGIPTPYPRYNAAIGGGLRRGCVDLIGARQKSGKTFFALNTVLHVASMGLPAMHVDTEMSKGESRVRVLANMSGVPALDIELGRVTREQRAAVEEAASRLEGLPYRFESARGLPPEQIMARIRRWIVREVGLSGGECNPCVIAYDYLKLAGHDQIRNNLAEHQLLGFLSSSLKDLMGRYGASCLCFAQLNREGIDCEDTRVLRGSDRILDTVTSFTLFKWKSDEERGAQMPSMRRMSHKAIPLICRFGPGSDDGRYIHMHSDFAVGRLTEGPYSDEQPSNRGGAAEPGPEPETEAVRF